MAKKTENCRVTQGNMSYSAMVKMLHTTLESLPGRNPSNTNTLSYHHTTSADTALSTADANTCFNTFPILFSVIPHLHRLNLEMVKRHNLAHVH
jgi:hypothetical protein